MDANRFDAIIRAISSRRAAVAGLLGTGLAAALDQFEAALTLAKRKKKKNRRKKRTLCLNGQTIKSSKKKRKKLIKNGATPGACPASPPSGCTPTCPGAACGIADGCGGTCVCAANAICRDGRCLDCTVVDANGLASALESGGEIVACPGRYIGTFALNASATLIGAGDGTDPATSTILDADGAGRVITAAPGVTAELRGLRVTGGKTAVSVDGAGIFNEGVLTLRTCTVTKNSSGGSGGGIGHTGDGSNRLTLDGCTVSDNVSGAFGGGIDNGCPATIAGSLISGNDAELDGGGIFNNDALTINASTITGNRTDGDGGGLFNSSSVATFDSGSAVVDNDADGVGGGIFNNVPFATIELNGANVSGNEPDECVGVDCSA